MSGRVCAVVVTYNRRDLLRECLVSLQAQTHVPDTILVVNNASTDGTAQMLSAEFAQLEVLTLAENVGGAGGFHAGMKWAYEQGYDWLWLMDDDGRAALRRTVWRNCWRMRVRTASWCPSSRTAAGACTASTSGATTCLK
jgi:GT2 family glycosyltransferase